jgi:hypothetical protein
MTGLSGANQQMTLLRTQPAACQHESGYPDQGKQGQTYCLNGHGRLQGLKRAVPGLLQVSQPTRSITQNLKRPCCQVWVGKLLENRQGLLSQPGCFCVLAQRIGHSALGLMHSLIAEYPLGFGEWLQALTYALSHPCQIAIVGDPDAADTLALLRPVRKGYRPFQLVELGVSVAGFLAVPLLHDRGLVKGQAAVYVCGVPVPAQTFSCQAPVTNPQSLEKQSACTEHAQPSSCRDICLAVPGWRSAG